MLKCEREREVTLPVSFLLILFPFVITAETLFATFRFQVNLFLALPLSQARICLIQFMKLFSIFPSSSSSSRTINSKLKPVCTRGSSKTRTSAYV